MFGMNLGSLMVRLRADTTQFHAALSAAEARLAKTGTKMRAIGKKMSLMVTAPLALIGGAAVKAFADFDDAMTKSVAIMSGVTPDLRKQMEDTARGLARDSITPLKDLAASYYYLASAGMDAAQSIKALPVVERFATAGAFDMSTATDLLTDAQSALGLSSKDATENMMGMLRVSDALVRANTLANASVQQFSEALTNTAGAAIKQYNMDLEEGVAILATYADQGLKGDAAGSMLGRMIRLLIKGVNDNREAFDRMNIEVDEFANTGKNITQVIEGITRATEGMGPAQKAATLEALGFQARIQQAILPLLGATEKIRGYEEELKKAGGTTEKVAKKQLTSFSSRMKMFKNRVALAADALGEALAPAVESIAEAVEKATRWFEKLDKSTKKWVAIVLALTAALGPLALILGTVIKGVSLLVKGVLLLKAVSLPMVAGIAALTAVVLAFTDAVGVSNTGILEWYKNLRTASGEKFVTVWKRTFHSIKGFLQDLWTRLKVWWEDIKQGFANFGHDVWDSFSVLWYNIERGFNYVKNKIAEGFIWLVEKALDAMETVDIFGNEDKIAGAKAIVETWKDSILLSSASAELEYERKLADIEKARTKRAREHEQTILKIMNADEKQRKAWEKTNAELEHQAFLEKLPDALKEKPPGVGEKAPLKEWFQGTAEETKRLAAMMDKLRTPEELAAKQTQEATKQMKGAAGVLGGAGSLIEDAIKKQVKQMTEGTEKQTDAMKGLEDQLGDFNLGDMDWTPQPRDFQEMSLRRFGLEVPSAAKKQKQEVEDKGVASRLDTIAELLQKKPVAVLG